jgi:hypothetical protein
MRLIPDTAVTRELGEEIVSILEGRAPVATARHAGDSSAMVRFVFLSTRSQPEASW